MKTLLILSLLATTTPAWSAAMDHSAMDMSKPHDMGSMDMGSMQGGTAPADARDPDYSQGRDFGPIAPPHMMGNGIMMSMLFNHFEIGRSDGQTFGSYEFEGWLGDDWNRAVIKSEGGVEQGNLNIDRTELLWRKPLNIFWNTELGVRQDSGDMPDRTWLALGMNGVSPYWLELSATAYVADQGRTALQLSGEYDWRMTQRLILQPSVEANLYGKTDQKQEVGRGLSDTTVGLRLRYEVLRVFAPYMGVEQTRQYGKTADFLSLRGEKTSQTQVVAGVRFWF